MSNDVIVEIANYIIDKQATVKEVAETFSVSVSTIKKTINTKLIALDADLYCQVKNVQKMNEALGKIKGGQKGKATFSWLESDAYALALQMINNKLSLSALSKQTNIPRSTLYDMFEKGITDPNIKNHLKSLYNYNRTIAKSRRALKEESVHEELQSLSNLSIKR